MKTKLQLIIGLFCFFAFGCYQPKEGCLDTKATNYDVTADENCCCEYPNLVLNLNYYWGEDTLLTNKKFMLDAHNIPYKLIKANFYISDIELIDSEGNAITISDSINIITFNGNSLDSIQQIANFAFCSTSGFNFKIGTFPNSGAYNAIRFKIGLSEPKQLSNPIFYTAPNPLAAQQDTMFNDAFGYHFTKWLIDRDTSAIADSLIISSFLDTGYSDILINFTTPFVSQEGYDAKVKIKIDFKKWLDGIGINDDISNIRTKIVNNASNAFKEQL